MGIYFPVFFALISSRAFVSASAICFAEAPGGKSNLIGCFCRVSSFIVFLSCCEASATPQTEGGLAEQSRQASPPLGA